MGVIVARCRGCGRLNHSLFLQHAEAARRVQTLAEAETLQLTSKKLRAGLLWIFTLLVLAWGSCRPSLNHSTEAPG